jgi:hypothetical protein
VLHRALTRPRQERALRNPAESAAAAARLIAARLLDDDDGVLRPTPRAEATFRAPADRRDRRYQQPLGDPGALSSERPNAAIRLTEPLSPKCPVWNDGRMTVADAARFSPPLAGRDTGPSRWRGGRRATAPITCE